jgi:metallo-beta-lactamase family protein
VKVKFLGATKTVTGSKSLVQTAKSIVLIDCGLYQGSKEEELLNREEFPISPNAIDAIILTHGHLDHCGFIPKLVRDGFKGKIFATKATIEIAKVILVDSAKIQEENSKKYTSKKNPLSQPLYTQQDSLESFNYFHEVSYDREFEFNDIKIRFKRAGHILGASSVYISEKKTILFSGDLGRFEDPLIFPPDQIEDCDLVVMESTYGNRVHSLEKPQDQLEKVLETVVDENKALLVPSFAVARAQLFIHHLKSVFIKRPDLEIPAFVNSPMINQVTEIYRSHNDEVKLSSEEFKGSMSSVRFLEWSKEYSKLNKKKGPLLIMAASGMMSGGRILQHLDHFGKYANNIVLLIGYQSQGTIGHSLENNEREISLLGHKMNVKAQILKLDNLSAHADQDELVHWLSKGQKSIGQVVLVHGEDIAQRKLKERIEKDLNLVVSLSKEVKEIEL